MKSSPILLFALALAAAPAATFAGVDIGVSVGGPEVVVYGQPPPLRTEVIGVAPGPGYIWIRGHWSWHHEHWAWIGGRWEVPAQRGTVWVPGRWVARGNGWVWVEGSYVVQAAPGPAPGMQAEVVASEEPPEAIVETIPVAPGPDYFWIGGHWHWNGGWVWVRGHYDRHPHFHPGAGWEPGHWDRRGGNWVWREGHWR